MHGRYIRRGALSPLHDRYMHGRYIRRGALSPNLAIACEQQRVHLAKGNGATGEPAFGTAEAVRPAVVQPARPIGGPVGTPRPTSNGTYAT